MENFRRHIVPFQLALAYNDKIRVLSSMFPAVMPDGSRFAIKILKEHLSSVGLHNHSRV